MEKEIMPDCAAEAFYQYLIPAHLLGSSEKSKEEVNRCVVLCKKVTPNLFEITRGVAVVGGAKTFFNDGICMIAPSTKVVFVLE